MLPCPKSLIALQNNDNIETLGMGLQNPIPLRNVKGFLMGYP